MNKKLHLISLGCTKNLVDSEVMLGALQDYELTSSLAEADVVIINTCGFIQAAKQESVQTILQAAKERKSDSILVASGCLSERYAKELQEEIPEIDIIIGVGDYDKIDSLLKAKQQQSHALLLNNNGVFLLNEHHKRLISGSNLHAYIKLSEGCNQQCSFCAIPHFKGKLHSRSLQSTLKEVTNLAQKGYCDFTFISQDSSSYLRDMGIKDGLKELVLAIDDLAQKGVGIKSARILYLYPATTSKALLDAIIASPIFHNYFDMPLQHVSQSLLQKMGRKGDFLNLLEEMRKAKDSFIRTSFIIGHPGESEADFEALCDFVEHFPFDRINFFAFSSEEGTKSHRMRDKIPPKVIKQRLKIIQDIFHKKYLSLLGARLHQEFPVIIEKPSSEHEFFYQARDIRHAPEIDGEILVNDIANIQALKPGFYQIKITQIVGEDLIGRVIGEC